MKNLLPLIFIVFTLKLNAQIGINATGAAPATNAMLDVTSTTKGLLMPRMTTIQRNALTTTATDGLTVYDTDTKSFWYYRTLPLGWAQLSTGGASPWTTFGANIYNNNAGNVGINTTTPSHALQVTANNKYGIYSTATVFGTDTIAAVYGKAISPTPVPFSAGVRGESNSTNYNGIGVLGIQKGSGWGVAGFINEEGTTGLGYGAGIYGAAGHPNLYLGGTGGFGVFGANYNNGGTAGNFSNFDGNINSKALRTNGKLQFIGIGAAAGKVLTSDVSGNATWEALPASANTWAVSGTNIINTNTGGVGIGTNVIDGFTKLQVLNPNESYMKVQSAATNKSVAFGVKNPDHQWFIGMNIGNYTDGRFNLFHTSSDGLSNVGQFLTVTTNGNVGIGDYSGVGVAPTERLEIKDGYLKVSGTNKTAFVITAGTGSTIFSNRVRFSYPGMSSTDILIVNHQYVGAYIGAVGNWYDSVVNQWSIFREDQAAMPAGEKFTVLVIKQ